jgi:hypothetical protein
MPTDLTPEVPAPNPRAAEKELLDTFIEEGKRLEKEALEDSAGHNEEALAAEWLHKWIGIPSIVISALAGLASGATSASAAGAATQPNLAIPAAVVALLSFSVTLLASLSTFLDPKTQAANQYKAANAYWQLRADARNFYLIECKKPKSLAELESELLVLQKKIKDLDDQTPMVSDKASTRGIAKTKDGTYV